MLTEGVPPRCSGYLGPGGLHDNSSHWNCSGGAAGLIDRAVFGQQHLYQHPTFQVHLTQLLTPAPLPTSHIPGAPHSTSHSRSRFYESSQQRYANVATVTWLARHFETVKFPITSSPRSRPSNWANAELHRYKIVAVSLHKTHICVVKSLVKIAAVSWHSLRRFIKPAPAPLPTSHISGAPHSTSHYSTSTNIPHSRCTSLNFSLQHLYQHPTFQVCFTHRHLK